MNIPIGLNGPAELFRKLQRDSEALGKEVTSDGMFNFVVTAYSLIDWVRNNSLLPISCRKAVEHMWQDKWIQVCGDLATAAKHFVLKDRKPITKSMSEESGYGHGRYGYGGYGVGEPTISIELNDGTIYDCLELGNGAVASWQKFFSDNKII